MGSRVRVPYTPQTLLKVQCFRRRFALYVIYILAKFKTCFDRLQSGKTQTCKRTQAQARPLMRATRPEVAEKYSDAGRVAPISVSVSSSTKRYHQTLPLSASSNGDASRVGNFFQQPRLAGKMQLLFSRVRFSLPFLYPAGRVAPISDSVWCLSSFVCLRITRYSKSPFIKPSVWQGSRSARHQPPCVL